MNLLLIVYVLVNGYFLTDCLKSLGISSSTRIPDADMSASTSVNSQYAPLGGRLNFQDQVNSAGQTTQIGGWAALHNDQNQYLQIKFDQIFQITGVATQGRQDAAQWVKSYKLEYSTDGSTWIYYPDVRCTFKVLLMMITRGKRQFETVCNLKGNCCATLGPRQAPTSLSNG